MTNPAELQQTIAAQATQLLSLSNEITQSEITSALPQFTTLLHQMLPMQTVLQRLIPSQIKTASLARQYAKKRLLLEQLSLKLQTGQIQIAKTLRMLETLSQENETCRNALAQHLNETVSESVALSFTLATQISLQISLLQKSETLLYEKLEFSLLNTYPLWKTQMGLLLAGQSGFGILQMHETFLQTVNETTVLFHQVTENLDSLSQKINVI